MTSPRMSARHVNSDIVELAGTNGWNGFSLIRKDPPARSDLDGNGLAAEGASNADSTRGPGRVRPRRSGFPCGPGASRDGRLRDDREVEVRFEGLVVVRRREGRERGGTLDGGERRLVPRLDARRHRDERVLDPPVPAQDRLHDALLADRRRGGRRLPDPRDLLEDRLLVGRVL